jgi:NTE family protein
MQVNRPDQPSAAPIAEVRVIGAERSNPAVIRAAMQTQAGQPFDQATADRDMKRIYGRGDFESATYWLERLPDGKQLLNVEVKEKSWGPQYVRFGLGLSSDFTGNANFQLMASHRATWLDPLGAEWRNDINIGHTDRLRTEWFQPLDERQRVFLSGRAELERTPFDIYDLAGTRVARYRRDVYGVGADVGLAVGPAYEFRLGLTRNRVKLVTDTGVVPGSVLLPRTETGGVALGVKFDTLDNLRFPRTGHAGELQLLASRRALGTDDNYNRVTASYLTAFSSGRHALELAARGVKLQSKDALPLYELSQLGGFLNLSGLRTGELLGHTTTFGRATYTLRTARAGFFDGAYVGVSAEIGRVSDAVAGPVSGRTVRGMALYVAVDTPLGPAYLAYGRASGSRNAFYLVLGQP